MKMKSRVAFGLGFVFLLVFVIAGLSIYYLNRISVESKAILKDNYKSLEYVEKMTQSLNSIRAAQLSKLFSSTEGSEGKAEDYQKANVNLDKYITAERNNITEPGEKELVASLKGDADKLRLLAEKMDRGSVEKSIYANELKPLWSSMENALGKIHDLNMRAILAKYEKAKVSSNRIIAIMTLFTVICLVMADLYYFYFPNYVAFGLMTLSERMKDIASGNYDEKLNLDSGDEFQEISESFDKIVEQLRVKEKYVQ